MTKTFLILTIVLVSMLMRLKPADIFLRTFNTLVHELSHAFVAVLFGQKVQKIVLNRDFSGSCITNVTNKRAMFFISLAGYILPAVIGLFLIYMTRQNITATTFYVIMSLNIISLITIEGNSFGRLWTLCFTAVNFIFALVPVFQPFYKHILYIYACMLLVENFFSTITLLYITLITPKKAGDATLLKKATKIPAIFWSLFFFCFSLFAILFAVKYLSA
ncbi:MAG: M50 family metallopeptidase [Bacteroidales bacterium]|nr:M50 family metallopeptidase [Bacteroidales bacterium]